MDTVELQITVNGATHKYNIYNPEFKIFNELLVWYRKSYFGKFEVKKEGDKITTNQSVSNVIKSDAKAQVKPIIKTT